MMSNLRTTALFSLLLVTFGCTDKRMAEKKTPARTQTAEGAPQALQTIGDIRITKAGKTANITVYQMAQYNGSIYVTGTADSGVPLGFARWDINSNPESPTPLFNVGDNIDAFQPIGRWRPDWYGSGALAVAGNYAIMSGVVGSSFIDMSQATNPVETKRYPMIDNKNPQTPQDPQFVYRAIVPHPSQPLIYGFRESDYIVVSSVSQNGLQPVGQIPYGSGNVCCVQGATVFRNQIYVGMRGMLRVYDVASSGQISTPKDVTSLQAVNVTSTPDLLYVQHQPSYGKPEGVTRPAGIYVFDQGGNQVNFLPIQPIKFVVSDDNSHIYANMDDTSVRIFRINWTN